MAGFDVVSTANNHSFDGEEVGLLDTVDHLDAAGVWAGRAWPTWVPEPT